jgi:hypothetical protein
LTRAVKADAKVREEGRNITQRNLLALCWVLGYCLFDEEVHREAIQFFPPKDPTLTLNEWIGQSNEAYKRVGTLLLPRGVFKSTLSMVNCAQLLICWPEDIAIMIVCGRADLAFDFVSDVGGYFFRKHRDSEPTLFQALWPDLCVYSAPDKDGFTTAKRRTVPPMIEPAIWGESIESGVSGYHPNILISDDIHNNRNSRTIDGRSAITKKYKLAKKVLLPIGSEYRIGTIYGAKDIFCDEVDNLKPGTNRRVLRPAIRRRDGERMDENGFPDENEVELCFPTILSYDFLRAEYEADFDTFCSQYLLDQWGGNEVVFPERKLLAAMVDEAALPMEGEVIMHWRFPCMRRGWYTAVCAVGQIWKNRLYIIDAHQGYYPPSMLAKMVINTARQHYIHHVSVEDSPGARMMIPAIDNYALTCGWTLTMDWIGGGGNEESEEDSGTRDLRIRNTEAVLSTGRLKFFRGIRQMKKIMAEYTQYAIIPDMGFPDVVSRIADHLPRSIALEGLQNAKESYRAMQEHDSFNQYFNRGPYAPPEPEPEPPPDIEDERFTSDGLEILIPGLER